MPKWNSKGYLFPRAVKGHSHSLRHDMLQIGVCKLDRLLLKHDGGMLFRDQHLEVFSRWMYPIAYMITMIFFYQGIPSPSGSDSHSGGVPLYCTGRGADMVAGIDPH